MDAPGRSVNSLAALGEELQTCGLVEIIDENEEDDIHKWTVWCRTHGGDAAFAHYNAELRRRGFAVNTAPWDGKGFSLTAGKPGVHCSIDGFKLSDDVPLTVLVRLMPRPSS